MSIGFLFTRSGPLARLARFDLFLLFTIMSLLPRAASHVKLNAPRVLLPYMDQLSVNFTLQISNTVGCFKWYTSNTDIITVITEEGNVCPDRAIISTVPRTGGITLPLAAIVYFEDTKTQEVFRCHVIVERLVAISVEYTEWELHLDRPPAMFSLVGHGPNGNIFSSLDGIPFKWTIEATGPQTDPNSIVRFIPFSESNNHATVGVKALEARRLQGSNVLLEGLKTGSAKVIAKFQDSFYKDVAPAEVKIVVKENNYFQSHDNSNKKESPLEMFSRALKARINGMDIDEIIILFGTLISQPQPKCPKCHCHCEYFKKIPIKECEPEPTQNKKNGQSNTTYTNSSYLIFKYTPPSPVKNIILKD